MSEGRRNARLKQIEKGNDPVHTEPGYDVYRDHGRYLTGIAYRRRLEERLKEKDSESNR